MLGTDAAVLLATLAAVAPAPPPERPQPSEGPARTIGAAIRRANLTRDISFPRRRIFEQELADARSAARRLPDARAAQIRGALRIAERLAARGALGPERLEPVMAAVRATTAVFRLRPFPAPRERVQSPVDGLVYEFRPGSGVHPHPLASAGRLNALAGACLHDRREARCRPAALRRAADSLLRMAVRDGRRLALEYTFPFGTGRPPWTSGMAQATAAQALARAGRVTGDRRHVRGASALFRGLVGGRSAVPGPEGVGHFAMYSFQPSMRVLNGELQTLVGLADYARLSRSRRARRVLRRTSRGLASELGAFDTGAWTLYNAGGREATLHYHRLAADFAGGACRRRLARAFCPAARRFARYTVEPARLSLRATRITRAGRGVRVRLRASKQASGRLVVSGPRGVVEEREVDLGRRSTTIRFATRAPGRYRIALAARALNGRRATAGATVRAKPKPKPTKKRRRAKADKEPDRRRD